MPDTTSAGRPECDSPLTAEAGRLQLIIRGMYGERKLMDGGITARGLLKELLVLGIAFGVYYAVRLLVRESGFEPLYNSRALLQLEDRLYLDWEFALQRAFWNNARPVIHVLNFVYAWGYWLILAGSLGYLYARRREMYRCLRNAMLVSGLIGFLIFASFPVTPPRLAPVGIIDTVEMSTQERRVRKALALSLPALMGLTIIVTGNHYVIDAIVGGAVALVALVPWLHSRRPALREAVDEYGVF